MDGTDETVIDREGRKEEEEEEERKMEEEERKGKVCGRKGMRV